MSNGKLTCVLILRHFKHHRKHVIMVETGLLPFPHLKTECRLDLDSVPVSTCIRLRWQRASVMPGGSAALGSGHTAAAQPSRLSAAKSSP